MTVAVFGATGFIGSHLIQRLRAKDIDFVGFGHSAHSSEMASVDFENPASYSHLLHGIETVVLLVTQSRPGSLADRAEVEVMRNVLPHARFVEVAASANVKRIIFVSSGGTVYGRQADRNAISESHATRPISPYGAGKLMVETMLMSFLGEAGISLTILRPANPVGLGQPLGREGFVTSAVHAALNNRLLKVWGDGSVVRDYFAVTDLAEAIICAFSDQAAGRIYNVGSGVGTSVNEVIGVIEAMSGRAIQREYYPGRLVDVPINVLSYAAIERDLGWRPKSNLTDLVQGLLTQ